MFLKKDPTLLPDVQEIICDLQRHCGYIHEIHALGDRAVSLLETIQKKKNLKFACDESLPGIQELVLIDRSIDFSSLFITPLTYEGLIDEFFGINMNTISIDAEMIGRVYD